MAKGKKGKKGKARAKSSGGGGGGGKVLTTVTFGGKKKECYGKTVRNGRGKGRSARVYCRNAE